MSFASLNIVCLPSISKCIFLRLAGVGLAASGYCFKSSSCIRRGGRIKKGGNFVVVVVVVVTTVVWVAGANESCPSNALLSTSLGNPGAPLLRGLWFCVISVCRDRWGSWASTSITSSSSETCIIATLRSTRASGSAGELEDFETRRGTVVFGGRMQYCTQVLHSKMTTKDLIEKPDSVVHPQW